MTNIARLLEYCPKGTKLYSPLFGEVEFDRVVNDGLPICILKNGVSNRFDKYGRYIMGVPDAECLLFPSKEVRTWEGWQVPVEPKFKVGDWIINEHGFVMQITKVEQYVYHYKYGDKDYFCDIEQTHRSCHLWTIEDAKDGDVLVTDGFIFIFKNIDNGNGVHYYCAYELSKHKNDEQFHVAECNSLMGRVGNSYINYSLAIPKQRKLLFDAMINAGYRWYAGAKELKKIKSHYDISNFRAGMPVLVRNDKSYEWDFSYYGWYKENNPYPFRCVNGGSFIWCIPYEGNETLLGTTDMCAEEFINW